MVVDDRQPTSTQGRARRKYIPTIEVPAEALAPPLVTGQATLGAQTEPAVPKMREG